MDLFGEEIQKAHIWLNDLTKIGKFRDDSQSLSVLRVVLHGLRDRLPYNDAVHLAAQLPTIIRGIFYDGWDPDKTPTDISTVEEFIDSIKDRLTDLDINIKEAPKAVCKLLEAKLNPSSVEKFKSSLPKNLHSLFI